MKRSVYSRIVFLSFVSVLFLSLHGQGMAAPAYPTKAIDLILPFNPGGGADVAARLFATYLSKKWNVPINVINKTGGAGIIGTRDVLVAPPDGYTMLGEGHATSTLLDAFQANLPFKWDNRTFICRVTLDPLIYLVRPDAPWKNLKEVADFALKNPKSLRWGNGGLGGVSAAAGIQFFMLNKIPVDSINRVVFQGETPVIAALAGSHIDFAGQQTSASIGMVAGKKIKPLAVVSGKAISIPSGSADRRRDGLSPVRRDGLARDLGASRTARAYCRKMGQSTRGSIEGSRLFGYGQQSLQSGELSRSKGV